jgi:dTDP-4-amino-4,6-dideoxygalactose transaminase
VVVQVPTLVNGATSVWAQYTILVDRRDEFAKACRDAGVPTAIHYLSPIHALPSYREFPKAPGLHQTDSLARRVISLPMHAYLAPETQDRIIDMVQSVVRSLKAGVAAE